MDKQRKEFEKWMLNVVKIVLGSGDPYVSGLEREIIGGFGRPPGEQLNNIKWLTTKVTYRGTSYE